MKHNDKKIVEYAKSVQIFLKEDKVGKNTIKSSEEFQKFMENEKFAKAGLYKEITIIRRLAKEIIDGKREIHFDFEKLSPKERRKAQALLAQIEDQIFKQTNPIYGTTYQTFVKLTLLIATLLSAGAMLFMGSSDKKTNIKTKKFIDSVRKVGDPRKKTPKELMSFVKNIVSLIEK